MLNPASPLPLYRQLADRLSTAIRAGQYPVGEKIPSEHALAARYGIGRPTVRQATESLVRRGLLERRRGAGTFVTEAPQELDVFSISGTLASLRDRGVPVQTRLLKAMCTVQPPAAQEHPFAGRPAHFFSRLTATEQGPALIEETYLDPELFGGLMGLDLQDGSLAALVREHYGTEPTSGHQQFGVIAADPERAAALELSSGAPLLQVRRRLHFPRGESAIYSELYCRTDRLVLSQQLGAA